MSFISRAFLRISYFTFKILKLNLSPLNLKNSFSLKNKNHKYNLRSNKTDLFHISGYRKSKYGDLVFSNIFSKFLNNMFPIILSYNFDQFRCFIFSDFNQLCNRFITNFPNFNAKYDIFFYKLYYN